MPQQLSRASVATCTVLAVVGCGGAYALAHGRPAKPAPAPASPTTIRLKDDPIGKLRRVGSLPPLRVPRPRPKPKWQPAVPVPVVTTPTPVVPAAAPAPAVRSAPAPTPAPRPRPKAPAKKPQTFDDSG